MMDLRRGFDIAEEDYKMAKIFYLNRGGLCASMDCTDSGLPWYHDSSFVSLHISCLNNAAMSHFYSAP